MKGEHFPDLMTKLAVEYIEQNKNNPFLCMLHSICRTTPSSLIKNLMNATPT